MRGASEDLRRALDAFRRIVQALRVSTREAERLVGLSGAQLFALQQLATMPGASVNDLAALTFTHQSSVSVVVRHLVERRLVEKVVARDDRRRVRLALTETGRALLRRSPKPVQHQLVAGIAALDSADRRTLARALSRVAQLMAGTHGPGPAPMLFEGEMGQTRRRARRTPRSRARRRIPR
ncbi:MAG: MarR family winged helix-turn-helix transcriptional regulator [Betaproteobacteria bacterium]